jgi:hypothetical protein
LGERGREEMGEKGRRERKGEIKRRSEFFRVGKGYMQRRVTSSAL